MGMAIPGDDEIGANERTASVASQPQQPEVVAPTPAQDVPASPVFANMQNASEEAPVAEQPEGNADDDIQAYMNRLLNRSDSPEAQSQPVPVAPVVGVPPHQVQEQQPVEEVKPLSADEFVPTHKATRPENYDTLREIANTTSRTAIETSSKNEKKGGLLKLVLALVLFSFAGAAYLFMTGTLDKSSDEKPTETTVQQPVDK